jgi:hypothetical protein
MTDPIAPVPPTGSPLYAPVEPPHAEIRSGWKTTEAWLAMLLLGGLATVVEQLINALPAIMATPGLPAWIAPIVPVAVVGLGWVMKLVVAEYTKSRVALKLGNPDVTAAIAAGAAAAAAGQAATLAKGNS